MVSSLLTISRRGVRRILKAAHRGGRGGASVVTSEQAGPQRFSALRAAPCTFNGATVSPLKCLPEPENEMFGPQPAELCCLTDTRPEMGVGVGKWRGIESYFRVSLGVAWQRRRSASKVVG